MICAICGKEGGTEPSKDGRLTHDWCRDSLNINSSFALQFFESHGLLTTKDALDKLMCYPKLVNNLEWLKKTLDRAAKACIEEGGIGAVLPKHIFIETELSFSSF